MVVCYSIFFYIKNGTNRKLHVIWLEKIIFEMQFFCCKQHLLFQT